MPIRFAKQLGVGVETEPRHSYQKDDTFSYCVVTAAACASASVHKPPTRERLVSHVRRLTPHLLAPDTFLTPSHHSLDHLASHACPAVEQ